MQDSFFESTEKLLSDVCTPASIRNIEHGGETSALWASLDSSGFGDALLPEQAGGAGLALRDIGSVLFSIGRHAVPLPFAHTILARAWLNQANQVIPAGAITFAPFQVEKTGSGITAHAVNFGKTTDWVLAQQKDDVWLLPVAEATVTTSGGYGSLDADLRWSAEVGKRSVIGRWQVDQFQTLLALSLASMIAGGADRVYEMTLVYANQRVQFGKPIGKFQALQQQISEMAEQVFGTRMAAQMACQSSSWCPQPALVAMAKAQNSQAVARVTATAHAVHGAIGVTAEYDLQLYTRRLNEWARLGGGHGYWAQQLGAAVLQSERSALDYVRLDLFGEPA